MMSDADQRKLTFAQKHPKANLVISFALLIAVAIFAFMAMEWLFSKLGLLLSKLNKWMQSSSLHL